MTTVRIIPPTGSFAEVKRYRDEHGCSLIEAVRATGFKGYRIERGQMEWVPESQEAKP